MDRPEIERITTGVLNARGKNPTNAILKDFEEVLIWVKVLEEEHKKLAERVRDVAPYVKATISMNNCFDIEGRPDWVRVHKGRAVSSHSQLTNLENEARATLKWLGGKE